MIVVYALAGGGGCGGGGAVTVHVAAAPEIAPAVTRAAGRFNDARREVEGRCARAVVSPTDPLAVTTLLSGRGVAGDTRRPDVWIPDSSMWSGLAESAPKSTGKGRLTPGRPVAASPVVVAMPRSLAASLKAGGAPDGPSWLDLLKAASGSGSTEIRPGLVRVQVPDPDRTATGMAALSMAAALPQGEPGQDGGDATFTGVVRTLRQSVSPSVGTALASFRRDGRGRRPVALVPEQAVFGHNAKGPAEAAVAVYPSEGTFSLDYPFVQVGNDPLKARAGRALAAELGGDATGRDVRDWGSARRTAAPPAGSARRPG
ncbi:substrate-binding domain-containing protein [Spirillospora sp. CA-294931]|uniref:substrate-binding domain-containing protein n=1 Tax=Spirillospora sp. CA-294931 TaxID=3240042 RepID=UPI003D8CF592